jgi:hypothetical protein
MWREEIGCGRTDHGQPLSVLSAPRDSDPGWGGSQAPTGWGASLPRPDSASVRQPRPLSWQQAVAPQPKLLPPCLSQARPLLWATPSAGSHARQHPLPVKAIAKGE